ncbi:reverse transcriptase domain-containing protein [Tanacetum coccineum]|uniref:Reverse transcriptase domain-containing protein n=1 Tax=Tanacetum coccineum TaxID=301880 RepID=A0ABQ5GW09_9ASTR
MRSLKILITSNVQPTPSHPRSDVQNTVGKDKQTPQGFARTTSAVDLEEFCEKHYEKLLPIMADKYEHERKKKEKLEEVKARLDFGDVRKRTTKTQESAYSESRTRSPRGHMGSHSPRQSSSVFTRLKRERSRSPGMIKRKRHEEKVTSSKDLEAEDGVCPHTPTSSDNSKAQNAALNQERKKNPRDLKHQEGRTGTISKKEEASTSNDILKAGKLSHLIKELKQNSGKDLQKKKGEPHGKEKPQAILMIQPWQKAVRQKITQSFSPDLEISFPSLGDDEGAEGPLIIEAEIGGHQVHRMCVDGGSSFEILYEHCFNRLRPEIRNQMVPAATSLVGFSGEIKWPLGQITLLVKVGDDEHSTSTWMDFMVVRSTSPYNGIIGRPGLRKMKAVPSTTHGMIKFPVMGGTLTLRSSKIIPIECATVSGPEDQPPPVNKVEEERIKVAINPEHTEQTVMIGSNLTERARAKLCDLLQRNVDVFAWTPKDMTGVPRHVAEHRLNVREGCQPIRQKKRGQAAERNIAINEEVSKLVTAGIMREVHYHDWLSNPVMVKKHDDSWNVLTLRTSIKHAPRTDTPFRK